MKTGNSDEVLRKERMLSRLRRWRSFTKQHRKQVGLLGPCNKTSCGMLLQGLQRSLQCSEDPQARVSFSPGLWESLQTSCGLN